MLAGDVIKTAARQLSDPDFDRWSIPDHVRYLNEGCMEVVRMRPEANADTTTVQLIPGTRQEIPSSALALLQVIRNIPGGRAVRFVDPTTLDGVPSWHNRPKSQTIRDYTWREDDPHTFWVFPPATEDARLELTVSRKPKEVSVPADLSNPLWDQFPLTEIWREPVIAWMLYRAWSVDTGEGSPQKASNQFQQFRQSLGLTVQGRRDTDPQPGNLGRNDQ